MTSEGAVEVQAVKIHATAFVGAAERPGWVPVAISHLVALNWVGGLRATLVGDLE